MNMNFSILVVYILLLLIFGLLAQRTKGPITPKRRKIFIVIYIFIVLSFVFEIIKDISVIRSGILYLPLWRYIFRYSMSMLLIATFSFYLYKMHKENNRTNQSNRSNHNPTT